MKTTGYPEQLPDQSWTRRPEPCLVPVPASEAGPLIHRRVVLHDVQAKCWRYDVIAISEPDPDEDGELVVTVLDQHDFHRPDRDRLQVASARVALRQLWVEKIYLDWSAIPDELKPQPVDIPPEHPHLRPDAWLVDTSRPPIRRMRQGNKSRGVLNAGTRAVENTPDGLRQGFRVISEPYLHEYPGPNLTGDLDRIDVPNLQQTVTVCDERDFFAWATTGTTPPSARTIPLGALFLE